MVFFDKQEVLESIAVLLIKRIGDNIPEKSEQKDRLYY